MEVERFKIQADNAAECARSGNYTLEDENLLLDKAKTIVKCYIDSEVPPRVQVCSLAVRKVRLLMQLSSVSSIANLYLKFRSSDLVLGLISGRGGGEGCFRKVYSWREICISKLAWLDKNNQLQTQN